jgi:hypothetical protein
LEEAKIILKEINYCDKKKKGNNKPIHFIFAMDDSGSMREDDGEPMNRWE